LESTGTTADTPSAATPAGSIAYAVELITVNPARLKDWRGSATDEALSLGGPCPECGHATSGAVPRQLSALEARIVPAGPERLTVRLDCACQEPHAGRPDNVTTGCGRTWLAATTTTGGTVALAPAPVPDPELAAAIQAVHDLAPAQLNDVRSAAGKWMGGVSALAGLFSLTGVAITRTTVAGLATSWQVLVALAALASVALAGWAIYLTYQAAYGWPTTADVSTDDKRLAWWKKQEEVPFAMAEKLRQGVLAAAGSLAAIVVTIGLLWFAPQKPAGSLVQATLTDGTVACGTLLPTAGDHVPFSAPAGLVMQLASNGSVVLVPVKSLASVSPVSSCLAPRRAGPSRGSKGMRAFWRPISAFPAAGVIAITK
jgi:hypothetical protein